MINIRTEYELTDVLINCFESDVGTETESLLHDDKYVTSKLKKCLGSKLFKEYDALSKEQWKDAWNAFDLRMEKKQSNT